MARAPAIVQGREAFARQKWREAYELLSAADRESPLEPADLERFATAFPDSAFDVVLCQMGLQFVPGKLAALREMRRVLETGGRAVISVPGPKPPLFAIMTDALARHLSPEAASFGDLVFSMHDVDELKELMRSAGFRNVDVQAKPKNLRLPAPADFLWQYIHSTPLAEPAAQVGEVKRSALEGDVCERWQEFMVHGSLSLEVGMTTATALK